MLKSTVAKCFLSAFSATGCCLQCFRNLKERIYLEEVLKSEQLHGRLWIKSGGLGRVQEKSFRLSLFPDNDT